jgi:hypothetical protein
MIDPLEDCYGFSEELHEGVLGAGRSVCWVYAFNAAGLVLLD